MSRRQTLFRVANIAPQTACSYLVYIPSIITSPFAVEATSLPFADIETKTITIRGITYTVPVKRKAQGTWTCTLNDSILLTSVYQALYKMYNEFYRGNKKLAGNFEGDDENGNPMSTFNKSEIYSAKMKNIYIFMTDGISGVVPMLTCVLKNCFITKIDPINLAADAATTPIKVGLGFQYNDIVSGTDLKKIKNPIAVTAVNAAKLAAAYGLNKGVNYLLNQ